jgi:probable HAF family extracellular repeat protein
MNDKGQIVGEYQDAAGTTRGFLLSGGRFTSYSYPKSIYSRTLGINLAGQIVGQYQSSDGKMHGYLLSNGSY